MRNYLSMCTGVLTLLYVAGLAGCGGGADPTADLAEAPKGGPGKKLVPDPLVISAADCTAVKTGTDIPQDRIGELVSGVILKAPTWIAATSTVPAHCLVEGSMLPVDPAGRNIDFAVRLPAMWTRAAVQQGGSGSNGTIPNLIGPGYLQRGWAALGSDSGHKTTDLTWGLNEEAYKNFGYMQMKKTHDAAWEIIKRVYGTKPVYSYYIGNSTGGREALTVVQKYPADYDGVIATVPVLNFTSLQLSQVFRRIQEKPLVNWVPNAKARAIATEVIRQCDGLDELSDGIINNYMACRSRFDANQNPDAWAAKRCPGNLDPNPALNTADACLTDGQIATLKWQYTPYSFATPLAFNTRTFGMWVANTEPRGDSLMNDQRFRGQEGAEPDAPIYSWRAEVMILGGLFQDYSANPLDYAEGGVLNDRRVQISEWMDATHANLTAFYKQGGKLIMMIGTHDTTASTGSQLDYYQAVLDRMGRRSTDEFARLYVLPHTNHGLRGNSYDVNGDGAAVSPRPVPNGIDGVAMLTDWVERGVAPPKTAEVAAAGRSLPLCSYPQYPRYLGAGRPTELASSYSCSD